MTLSWWKTIIFQLANSECFSKIAAFNWSILEQYLSEFNVWFYRKCLLYTMSFKSNHINSITKFRCKQDFGVVNGGSFFFSSRTFVTQLNLLLIVITYKQSIFHCPWLFFSKMVIFVAFEQRVTESQMKCRPLNLM